LLGFELPPMSSVSPVNPNAMINEEEQAALETKQLEKWIEEIDPDNKVVISEISECMEIIREVFLLNQSM